ncbi:pimeloyl-ACP methyl ester carboxylesterase [Pseudonocardia hierapolitana]|uniref:Pimeloyl-ACP methyl ester carboxylesterase n=1 Tax=Pseudonocardia hierapolitana TaxID=1128676 RepID=A0A561T2W4_9PSEU|nr:alpha/beta fold hydrolase [Pseudonocardia hierapolitana]TWF81453.1 pimeloyl-ACP methyl ester carboxylesterase [Pseudonocardia hierapolitana]
MDTRQRMRETLLAGFPVDERRRHLAGVSTAVLEGGDGAAGPPVVLLHGPGEFAATWLPVLPRLARAHHVIVPDLPGHGDSLIDGVPLDAGRVLDWLGELVEETCAAPPVLVGKTIGGAVAARFAAGNRRRLAALVLVDSLGLTAFDPAPRFGLALHRFLGDPTPRSYERFMEFCAFDLDRVREHIGMRWDTYAAYAVELAADDRVQAALGGLIGQFAAAPIPPEQLAGIDVPTTLIWGRHDLATPLSVAEAASARYGWPLHVVEDAGDDPALDRPDAFIVALQASLGTVAVP